MGKGFVLVFRFVFKSREGLCSPLTAWHPSIELGYSPVAPRIITAAT